ncbi:MAG: winged helix-turn-helix transcriptional regulator [Candidatus Hodarchaeota archaeon]
MSSDIQDSQNKLSENELVITDHIDLEILLHLQEKPLIRVSKLAEKMNISHSTVSRRLARIKQRKAYHGVHIDLKLSVLELELADYFLSFPNKSSLLLIEKTLADTHPYTLYRGRCYGVPSGLFTQFRIPQGTRHYIDELFNELQQRGLISSVKYLRRQPYRTAYSNSSLKAYNSKLQTWVFDWEGWITKFQSISPKPSPKETHPSLLPKLDKLDIQILGVLTKDYRQKNTTIMNELNVDKTQPGVPQMFGRRLNFLRENVVERTRVFLNWTAFDLYQTFAFIGKASPDVCKCLNTHLLQNPLPFESVFFLIEKGFLWYIRAPPSHFSILGDFVWSIAPQHNSFMIDYRQSEVYGLWPETFDDSTHQWKKSHKFMVEEVLQQILQQKV